MVFVAYLLLPATIHGSAGGAPLTGKPASPETSISPANRPSGAGARVFGVPAAPAGLTAVPTSDTQIVLNWSDASSDESGFVVEYASGPYYYSDMPYFQIARVGANVTSYTVTNLTPGAVYYYRIRAVNADGPSAYSNVATTNTTVNLVMNNAPATTCSCLFTDSGGKSPYINSTLHYYNNSQTLVKTFTPALPGYRLRVSFSGFDTEPGFDQLSVYDGGSTSDPLVGTYSGNTLPETVTATNAAGKLTFKFTSNATTTREGWAASLSCVDPPAAPTTLSAALLGTDGAQVTWTDNATNETGFRVERSERTNAAFGEVAVLGPNTTRYQDAHLQPGATYFYRVTATGTKGNSAYSNQAALAMPQVLNPPQRVTVVPVSAAQFTITWTDNASNEQGFRIERAANSSGGPFAEIATVGANVTTYQDRGLNAATAYWYRVRTFNGAGVSVYSNTAAGITPGAWQQRADFPGPARQGAVSVTIGGKMYVGMGLTQTYLALQDWWEFDPATGSWTQRASFPGPGRLGAARPPFFRRAISRAERYWPSR